MGNNKAIIIPVIAIVLLALVTGFYILGSKTPSTPAGASGSNYQVNALPAKPKHPAYQKTTVNNPRPEAQSNEVSVKTTAEDKRIFLEQETERICGIINATPDQKDKIRAVIADFNAASADTPPEQAPEACARLEARLREILTVEQQNKLSLK